MTVYAIGEQVQVLAAGDKWLAGKVRRINAAAVFVDVKRGKTTETYMVDHLDVGERVRRPQVQP